MKARTKLLLVGVPPALAVAGVAAFMAVAPAPGPERIDVNIDFGDFGDFANIVGVRAGTSYAYIVHRDGRAVLVDAGSDTAAAAIRAELSRLEINLRDVEAILLTHAHGDHWGGVAAFAHAPAYIGKEDHLMLRGDRLPKAIVPKISMRLGKRPPVHPVIRNVLPGMALEVAGFHFEVIGVPGHTPGSVMYKLGGVLFTGDSLMIDGDEVDRAPGIFSDRPADNTRSLYRLQTVPFTVIADGHTGTARDGRARYERWLSAQR